MQRCLGLSHLLLASVLVVGAFSCSNAGQGAKATNPGSAIASSGGTSGGGATTLQGSGGSALRGSGSGGNGSGGQGMVGSGTGGTASAGQGAGGLAMGGSAGGKGDASAVGQGSDGAATGGTASGSGGSAGKGGTVGGDAALGSGGGGSFAPDAASSAGGAPSSGGGAGTACTEPPAAGTLVGWASVSGSAGTATTVATTTGGGNATPVTVTSLSALNSAAAGTSAAVIYVKGVLAAGTVKIGSNKTIAGICGAELHGHVEMSGSVNVIFRNLKVVGYNCSDSPTECKSGADAITVGSNAHHLWFDHCDVSDGSDGNLDITNGSDLVTVSWTKFWYSTKRTDPVTGSTGHRFSNLIGAADGLAIDQGHLNITWHHNWWADNIAERMPRSRDGKIHVVNNLFTATGNDYCTNSGNLSSLLVENNVYIGVGNPLQEDSDGNMLARGNVFTNTSGSKTASGTGFTPPYQLTPDATTGLEATIRSQAGPK